MISNQWPVIRILLVTLALVASRSQLLAGDAVAIGYNQDGVWTAVTYYRSATRKGGRDYKTEQQARELASHDVRRRSEYPPTTIHIFSSSDKTGFVAVARGKNQSGTDIHGVGRGKTQAEADKKALELLNESGASGEQKIIYRYFTYGSDSKK